MRGHALAMKATAARPRTTRSTRTRSRARCAAVWCRSPTSTRRRGGRPGISFGAGCIWSARAASSWRTCTVRAPRTTCPLSSDASRIPPTVTGSARRSPTRGCASVSRSTAGEPHVSREPLGTELVTDRDHVCAAERPRADDPEPRVRQRAALMGRPLPPPPMHTRSRDGLPLPRAWRQRTRARDVARSDEAGMGARMSV